MKTKIYCWLLLIFLAGCNFRSSVVILESADFESTSVNVKTKSEIKLADKAGNLTTWIKYQYPQEGHVIKIHLSVLKESLGQVIKKEEWIGLSADNDFQLGAIRIKRWVLKEEAPFTLESIEYFDSKNDSKLLKRELVNPRGQVTSTITFKYTNDQKLPIGFIEVDMQGKTIADFTKYEPFDIIKSLKEISIPGADISQWKQIRENPQKFLVAVIDSGFDYNHPSLVTKWWNNPMDPIDALDNDNNGWVDDNFGWEHYAGRGLPTESTTDLQKSFRPLSHGTHVANIAVNKLNSIGLIGFAGDYTQVDYVQKISAFIKKHKVRIVNMSLGIPADAKDLLGLRISVRAYKDMIEENPDTLFVVASGNDGVNLDELKNRQYPASFQQANVITIGALETSNLSSKNLTMAKFSNYGEKSVHILAPGRDISAASLGGGVISHSGTSMATPFAANQIAQVWIQLPELNAVQIKQLILNTARVLTPRAPVISGGYIDVLNAIIYGKINFLKNQPAKTHGPNCWNSATYLANISTGIHHTTEEEIAYLLQSPLCKLVQKEELQLGDIVAFRRYDKNDQLLPVPLMSEVHAYTYLDENWGFSKDGVHKNAPYKEQIHADIFKNYRSKEMQNCKILGLTLSECRMKETFYHCQSLESTFENMSALEQRIILDLRLLEDLRHQTSLGFTINESEILNGILKIEKDILKITNKDLRIAIKLRLRSLLAKF